MNWLIWLVIALHHQPLVQRTYWPTSIDSMWVGHQKHTHAAVTGIARTCRPEPDGDRHIKLESETDATKYIVAEIIPRLPQPCPIIGRKITVYGITRLDTEHSWREIHPVEYWTYFIP
jgi:hypothetical protein